MTQHPATLTRTSSTLPRFLAALIALLVVAVGIPIGLMALSQLGLGRWHPIPHIGSLDEIRAALQHQQSSRQISSAIVRVLLGFCWLLWASLLVSVIAAVVDSRPSLARVRMPRLTVFDGIGTWIAAGLLVLSSFNPRIARAATPVRAASTVQLVQATTTVAPRSVVMPQARTLRAGWTAVQVGESVEMIADRTLGDATRWPEIWALNQHRTMDGHGTTWSEPWRITAGWELELPPTTAISRSTDSASTSLRLADQPSPAADTVNVDAGSDGAVEHIVTPGESYWHIAEQQLRIALGRQPTGAEVLADTNQLIGQNSTRLGTEESPHMLHVGDTVELSSPPTTPNNADDYVITAGDSYWRIAEHELRLQLGRDPTDAETLAYANQLIATNSARLGTIASPTMIHPGDVVHLDRATPPVPTTTTTPDVSTRPMPAAPAAPAAPPLVSPTPTPRVVEPAVTLPSIARSPSPAAPGTSIPDPVSAASPASTSPSLSASSTVSDGEAADAVGWVAGLSAVSAAGLGGMWVFRRRRSMRRARPHQRPAPMPEAVRSAVSELAARDLSAVAWMAAELRLMARQLPRAEGPLTVQLVQLDTDRHLEVAFSEIPSMPPPAGWSTAADTIWQLDAPHRSHELSTVADAPPVLPALVTLGDRSEQQLLLNLEATPGINLQGDPTAQLEWTTNAVWELAGEALAEHPTIYLVGIDIPGSDQLHRVTTLDGETAAELVRSEHSSHATAPMLTRRTATSDAFPTTIVILGPDQAAEPWRDLARLPSVGVIAIDGTLDGGVDAEFASHELHIPEWRLRVPCARITATSGAAAMELLDAADGDPIVDEFEVDEPTPLSPSASEVLVDEDWQPPTWPVTVHLLGTPYALRDGERLPLSPQQLSALAYLAVAGDVSVDNFNEALWAGAEVKSTRRRELLADLRKAAGGRSVVSHVEDGRLRAGPDLGTDLAMIEALNARSHESPDELIPRLHQMMNLVDGQPFSYPSSATHLWRWVDHPEHLQALWGLRISTIAWELAGHYLANHDAATARDIAERGLIADPLNETLTERLMEAYAALNAIEAVQRVYESHDRALTARGFDGASDDTRRLLERLRSSQSDNNIAATGGT